MNTTRALTGIALLALTLAGCHGGDPLQRGVQTISVLDGTSIAVHARNAPDAVISATGALSIDGKAVAVTPTQEALLKQYYDNALTLRSDAIATGLAGAATAGTAIRSVVTELANGTPDRIGPAVEARAAEVEKSAAKICATLGALRSTQQSLAADLPAFQPYAVIDANQVDDCIKI